MSERNRINQWPHWPSSRDWIGIGTFALTVMILWMMKGDRDLLESEFFKTIATLIIGTAFVNGVVSWAYSATKSGGEMAESSARIAEQAATAAVRPTKKIEIDQPTDKPIPVEEQK